MFWVQNSYRSKSIKQRILIAKQNKANQAKHARNALVSLGYEKWGAEHNDVVTSSLGLGNLILFDIIQLMKKIFFRHLIEVTALLSNTTSPPEKRNYWWRIRRALWLRREVSRAQERERKADQFHFYFSHTHEDVSTFSLFSVSLLMWVHGPGKLLSSWKLVALNCGGVFSTMGLLLFTTFVVASGSIDAVDLWGST